MTDSLTLAALWLQAVACVVSLLCLFLYIPARFLRTAYRFVFSFYKSERRHSLLVCWNLAVLVLCLQHGLLCVALLVGSFLNELHEAPCVIQGVLIYFSESGVFVYTMFLALVWCMQIRSLSGVVVAAYFVVFACVTVVPIVFFMAGVMKVHSYVVDHIWCRFYEQSWQYYLFQAMFRFLQAAAATVTSVAIIAGFLGYKRDQPQLRLKRKAARFSSSPGSTFASLVGDRGGQPASSGRTEDTSEASPYARLDDDEADLPRMRQVKVEEEHRMAEAELARREEEEWSPENEDRAEELRQLHDEAFMREMEHRYREHEGDSDEDAKMDGVEAEGQPRDADDASSVDSAMYAVQPREVLDELAAADVGSNVADGALRGFWPERLDDPRRRRGVLDVLVVAGLAVLYIGCWIGTFFQAVLYDFHTRNTDPGFVVVLVAVGRPLSALFGIRLAILLSGLIVRTQKARSALPPPNTSFQRKGPAEIESRVSVLDEAGALEMEMSDVGETADDFGQEDAQSQRVSDRPPSPAESTDVLEVANSL